MVLISSSGVPFDPLDRNTKSGSDPLSPYSLSNLASGFRRERDLSLSTSSARGVSGECFRNLIERLGIKTEYRRWWGFVVSPETTNQITIHCVASGGHGLAERFEDQGKGLILYHTLYRGEACLFYEPDPDLSLHSKAHGGIAIPLITGGRISGVFVLESEFREKVLFWELLLRLNEHTLALANELLVAGFRDWHRQHYGRDVYLGHSENSAAVRAASLPSDLKALLITGPCGVEQEAIALFIHYLKGGSKHDFLKHTLLWDKVEDAPALHIPHSTIAIELKNFKAGQSVILLTRQPVRTEELHQMLTDIPTIELTALRDRRREIPDFCRLVLSDLAQQAKLEPPTLSDGALAVLWRQNWSENLSELTTVLAYALATHRKESEIDGIDIQDAITTLGLRYVRRFDPFHPDRDVIEEAFATTLNSIGTFNQSRAALYLGWDCKTLREKAKILGIHRARQ